MEEPTEQTAADILNEKIAALPSARKIAKMSDEEKAELSTELDAIYAEIEAADEETLAELDLGRFEKAMAALTDEADTLEDDEVIGYLFTDYIAGWKEENPYPILPFNNIEYKVTNSNNEIIVDSSTGYYGMDLSKGETYKITVTKGVTGYEPSEGTTFTVIPKEGDTSDGVFWESTDDYIRIEASNSGGFVSQNFTITPVCQEWNQVMYRFIIDDDYLGFDETGSPNVGIQTPWQAINDASHYLESMYMMEDNNDIYKGELIAYDVDGTKLTTEDYKYMIENSEAYPNGIVEVSNVQTTTTGDIITLRFGNSRTINVDDTEQGTINPSKTTSLSNMKVTLTVEPDAGYKLTDNSLTVTPTTGDAVTVTKVDGKDNQYKFTMPAADVTVTAAFEEDKDSQHNCADLGEDVTAIPLKLSDSGATELQGGTYYLKEDMTAKGNIILQDDVTLCLNGKQLNMGEYTIEKHYVDDLTICDCSGKLSKNQTTKSVEYDGETVDSYTYQNDGGKIIGKSDKGYMIFVCDFIMKSGIIQYECTESMTENNGDVNPAAVIATGDVLITGGSIIAENTPAFSDRGSYATSQIDNVYMSSDSYATLLMGDRANPTWTINDGVFINTSQSAYNGTVYFDGRNGAKSITINDGIFIGEQKRALTISSLSVTSEIAINGGTFINYNTDFGIVAHLLTAIYISDYKLSLGSNVNIYGGKWHIIYDQGKGNTPLYLTGKGDTVAEMLKGKTSLDGKYKITFGPNDYDKVVLTTPNKDKALTDYKDKLILENRHYTNCTYLVLGAEGNQKDAVVNLYIHDYKDSPFCALESMQITKTTTTDLYYVCQSPDACGHAEVYDSSTGKINTNLYNDPYRKVAEIKLKDNIVTTFTQGDKIDKDVLLNWVNVKGTDYLCRGFFNYNITIKDAEGKEEVTNCADKVGEYRAYYGANAYVPFTVEKQKGTLQITLDKDAPEGASVKLKVTEDGTPVTGEKYGLTFDEKGECIITADKFKNSTYTIDLPEGAECTVTGVDVGEKEAAEGATVTIKGNETNSVTVSYELKKYPVSIKAVDADDETDITDMITIRITGTTGITTVTMGGTGTTDLPAGEYTINVNEPPEGYNAPTENKFEVESGSDNGVEWELHFSKKDLQITLEESTEFTSTIKVDGSETKTAKMGQKVAVTLNPTIGYAIDTVTVQETEGQKTVSVTEKNGTYSFEMPTYPVTVEVETKLNVDVKFRVVDVDNATEALADVTFTPQGSAPAIQTTQPDTYGNVCYMAEGLSEGTYTYTATKDGYVSVGGSDETSVTISVAKEDGTLTVRVNGTTINIEYGAGMVAMKRKTFDLPIYFYDKEYNYNYRVDGVTFHVENEDKPEDTPDLTDTENKDGKQATGLKWDKTYAVWIDSLANNSLNYKKPYETNKGVKFSFDANGTLTVTNRGDIGKAEKNDESGQLALYIGLEKTSVTFIVKDPDGQPIATPEIQVTGERNTRTDEGGELTVRDFKTETQYTITPVGADNQVADASVTIKFDDYGNLTVKSGENWISQADSKITLQLWNKIAVDEDGNGSADKNDVPVDGNNSGVKGDEKDTKFLPVDVNGDGNTDHYVPDGVLTDNDKDGIWTNPGGTASYVPSGYDENDKPTGFIKVVDSDNDGIYGKDDGTGEEKDDDKYLPDKDGDGKVEVDTDGDGIFDGSKKKTETDEPENKYLPIDPEESGKKDSVLVDSNDDGVFTEPDEKGKEDEDGIKYIPDQDGDKNPEPDTDGDGVYEGTSTHNPDSGKTDGTTYIPDGNGNVKVDSNGDGIYGDKDEYGEEKDWDKDFKDRDNLYVPVGKDSDVKIDGVEKVKYQPDNGTFKGEETGTEYLPDWDGDRLPEPDKDGDGIFEGTKGEDYYIPDKNGDEIPEVDSNKDGIFGTPDPEKDNKESDDVPKFIPVVDGENPEKEPTTEDKKKDDAVVDDNKDGIYGKNDGYGNEVTDEDREYYVPVDKDGDKVIDGVKEVEKKNEHVYVDKDGTEYIPDVDGDGLPEVDKNGDGVFEGSKDGDKFNEDGSEWYPSTGDSGSSSHTSKRYNIIVSETKDGTVKSSDRTAKKGATITLTVKADKDHELRSLTVVDRDGTRIELKDNGDGTYSFTMPRSSVTVTAKFNDEDTALTADDVEQKDAIILTINNRLAMVFGNPVMNDVAPVIRNERTMLPIRFVVENLGGTVAWDETQKKVTIVKEGTTIEIYIGQSYAYVNGERIALDSPAFIENSRTYLPLRFVAENLDATVLWKAKTQQVFIVPNEILK